MKTVTCNLLLILTLATSVRAQHPHAEEKKNDISIWRKPGVEIAAPWYLHVGEKYSGQIRYGTDNEGTLGVCAGQVFGGEEWKLVSSGCSFPKGHRGFGPEILVIGETEDEKTKKGKTFFFAQALYVFGQDGNPNFAFGLVDYQRSVWKDVTLGFGGEIEYEKEDAHHHGGLKAGVGPALGLKVHHMHFFFLPTFPIKGEQGKEITVGLRYQW